MTPPKKYEIFFHLAVSSATCQNVRVWAGGQGGWARKNRAAGHAPIASSIECPDICRTPLGARRERRRKAIIAGSEAAGRQQVNLRWLDLHPGWLAAFAPSDDMQSRTL